MTTFAAPVARVKGILSIQAFNPAEDPAAETLRRWADLLAALDHARSASARLSRSARRGVRARVQLPDCEMKNIHEVMTMADHVGWNLEFLSNRAFYDAPAEVVRLYDGDESAEDDVTALLVAVGVEGEPRRVAYQLTVGAEVVAEQLGGTLEEFLREQTRSRRMGQGETLVCWEDEDGSNGPRAVAVLRAGERGRAAVQRL